MWLADGWDAPLLVRLKEAFYLAKIGNVFSRYRIIHLHDIVFLCMSQNLTICSVLRKELKAAECEGLARDIRSQWAIRPVLIRKVC